MPTQPIPPTRIILGISGASGALYSLQLLEALRDIQIQTHLLISKAAEITIAQELSCSPTNLAALAHVTYPLDNLAAPIASGSFTTAGMIIAPCSIKTLSAIAYSHNDTLLTRAADVTLKEGRPLLLMVRETPLHLGHLRLLVRAAEIGAIIFPPMPALYTQPQSIDDLVMQTVGRMLARIGIRNTLFRVWKGPAQRKQHESQ